MKVDFTKSTCSEGTEKFYKGLVKKYLLNDGDINIKGLITDIKDFKDSVYESIRNCNIDYLPNASPKEVEAYKNPETNQGLRGVFAWNYIYPNNMIELPAKVSLLKLNIFDEEDILPLKETNPDIYNIIIERIFNDTTGMFVKIKKDNPIKKINPRIADWYKYLPKKYKTKYKKLGVEAWNEFVDTYDGNEEEDVSDEISNRGLQALAIPKTEKIPEWVLPYIDYTTLVNNILAPFMGVLDIFKIQKIEEGKTRKGTNRKTSGFSNIIKL